MKKIDLGQASQILANVGVMLGLVFLAVETGQNQRALDEQNTLARLSVRDSQFEAYSRLRHLLLSNPDLQQILIKGDTDQELTEAEKARYGTLCNEILFMDLTTFTRAEALGFPNGLRAGVRSAVRDTQIDGIQSVLGKHVRGVSPGRL